VEATLGGDHATPENVESSGTGGMRGSPRGRTSGLRRNADEEGIQWPRMTSVISSTCPV
jgi:hypothetical protein